VKLLKVAQHENTDKQQLVSAFSALRTMIFMIFVPVQRILAFTDGYCGWNCKDNAYVIIIINIVVISTIIIIINFNII